jgi:hydrogenase large subunit
MPEIFLPLVSNGSQATPSKRIVVDPITRIEGHLRIEVKVENGYITDAWSAATTFRGIELVMQGRDPRDAWIFAQRLCGVCTTVHSIASVRAVENALGIIIPDNARIIRNLIEGAQFVQDHVIHFYHLHALDWVDIVSALSADPVATSNLQISISDWTNNSPDYFRTVRDRIQSFVSSGQLGLFANGYWGHPAYKLPPEANLMAVAHYLEALDWQSDVIKIHALTGGKNPHPQTYAVGGMALPLDPTNPSALNRTKIATLKTLATKCLDFVNKVYYPDLLAIASFYKDWAGYGGTVGNYLSFGDFSTDNSGTPASNWLPSGVIWGNNLASPPIPLDQAKIQEYIAHSWYSYPEGDTVGKHPSIGVTAPVYSGPTPPYDFLDVDKKYSWLKAPRYDNQPMEVGPLARMLVAYTNGHPRITQLVNAALSKLGVGAAALFSTLGRTAARGIETVAIAEQLQGWITQLETNINNGNLSIHNAAKWDPSTWPSDAIGFGMTESPRGALGHWVHIVNGKITNYQMVVATVWNASPRDSSGQRGPYEQSLIGTPVLDPARPVEILRTIHSFDPCMACAVHITNSTGTVVTQIKVA